MCLLEMDDRWMKYLSTCQLFPAYTFLSVNYLYQFRWRTDEYVFVGNGWQVDEVFIHMSAVSTIHIFICQLSISELNSSRLFSFHDWLLKLRLFFSGFILETFFWRFFLQMFSEDFSQQFFLKIFPEDLAEDFSWRYFLKIIPEDFSYRFILKTFPI